MPLPLIPALLGGAAVVAGAAGVATAVDGASKMKQANDTMKDAEVQHKANIQRFENDNKKTTVLMDEIGKKELEILKSFEKFTDLIEKIHNRPEFKPYSKNGVNIPKYDSTVLNDVSVGAGVLLGGVGGAAAGTFGGFAAAGATTSAVMTFGTASTGTAIASLHGAAATNATLAALGGGAVYAGGGGMALGSAVLGAATLGVGLLVGGIIFNTVGSNLSDKADEAREQMLEAKRNIDKICDYLTKLYFHAERFKDSLTKVEYMYKARLNKLERLIDSEGKVYWSEYTEDEKLLVENTVLLVGLLYSMCQTKLVLKDEDKDGLNTVNVDGIEKAIYNANEVMKQAS